MLNYDNWGRLMAQNQISHALYSRDFEALRFLEQYWVGIYGYKTFREYLQIAISVQSDPEEVKAELARWKV